jgi:GNAT superfamily N-acetyltransferase
MKPQVLAYKLGRSRRLYGTGGSVRWACQRLLECVVRDERHVWLALDPAGDRPRPSLPHGLILRRGRESDLNLLSELETAAPLEARERIRTGNELWLVMDGDRPVFSCWIFHSRTPTVAARGGWLSLPAGTVCQEDSMTAPSARGRGVAPAAWAAIADAAAANGQHRVIRKTEVQNARSRRAGDKVGYKPFALMRYRRLGPVWRTSIRVLERELGEDLAARLDSRMARWHR